MFLLLFSLCNQETFCQSCVREQGFSRKLALSSMRWSIYVALTRWHIPLSFFSLVLTLHSLLHTVTFSCSSDTHRLRLTNSRAHFHTVVCRVSFPHTRPSAALLVYISSTKYSCVQTQLHFNYISHDVCVTGSKAQSNRANTGLWCLSGQGPGWAHGRGHHCLPEVRLFVCLNWDLQCELIYITVYLEFSFNSWMGGEQVNMNVNNARFEKKTEILF